MSPVSFLQRPLRWLEAISRYRGTVSGGPNFAYELCARKAGPESLAGLDLSSWRVAYNGAEPVRASTLERFAAVFAPCGFKKEAFYPCYGLAEATLFVTGGHGSGVERERVSCGRAWMGQRLVVADPETGVERGPGEEGEVWLSGPSVARGYWENPEGTARDFNAFLATGEGPFLRTGDLGFLAGGELYVTGRLKDLIILRGRNHYPQDVELTAERAHADLHPGGGAAFSVEVGGEERLVIVHEVARHRKDGIEAIAEAVRGAVAAEHEVQVQEVVLIRQGGLPKTSSGKVQRRLCRELYLKGELPVVGRSALAAVDPALELAAGLTREALAALEPAERRARLAGYLRERASAALGVPVGLDQPLTGLGLDSLSAIELKGAVESALGLSLPLGDLLQGISVAGLAERALAGAELAQLPPLRSLSLAGDQPLTPGQRGLWFLHRLAPEGGAYNIAVAARTRGLDAAAFARALAALAARHEALRTIFPMVGDEPVQRVLPELAPDVRIVDTPSDLSAEAWRPFSLERGPLLRARIFKGEDGETVLLVVHHIVADFASLAVMARDLAALYRGEALEPPALRYADYVHWQREILAGPRGERLWSYWRQRLAGLRDLDLPADHPRPPAQTWRGGARASVIPADLAAGLGALGAGRGATLFMTLLAGFQAQLGRYTGQEDFAVGAAVAGRPLPELAGLVGYFVNVLPLRADLAGEPGFGELLDRARGAALEGMEHGDLPFPLIAERLRPVRDPARSPLFQTALVLQRGRPGDAPGLAAFSLGEDGARVELGGLTLESVRLAERRAQFDLTLFAAEEASGGLGLALEYNADLFDDGTAERMLGHFQTLLAGAVAAPEAPFWSLPLLSESERGQFFQGWDDTAREYPGGLLHQLFEVQAARAPEAEAVVAGEARLTYGELNARANRLAHRLRRLGVGPEDRVGICLRRSERMIVGLLAVLKAGGAYVPLDPTYPRERLKGILDDSAARVVIGEEATAPRLAGEAGERWLAVDADLANESAENPRPVAGPSNLAYLIYTSGSTGRPKAVMIEHRSPVVLMHWARENFSPEELGGALVATSIGFDVSILEIFAPLSWGGRIFVVENLLALPALAAAAEVRLVCGAPSVVAELVRTGTFPSWVSTVSLGGEAVPPALVAGLRAAAPAARILNAYGPSEDTTYSTTAVLEAGREVTIGRPVANARVYLLDARGEPVPAGVPGELFMEGAGLSRGYLDRPEMTAEKFVPDPFAAVPGARLYRVGDLARRRPDGELEYLGRVDHQVKIRGFRVELGEIEAALARHPGVREAVVMARDDGDRGKRLVAYATPRGVASSELRSFLRESLPDYMVPTAFVHLDALPLSPNGKIDRRALPDPGAPAAAPAPVSASRGPVTEALTALMAEVLGVERVGEADDFFELGGHSLLATRLAARASRLFGVEVPVSAVLLHPTPAALAAQVAAGGAASSPVPPVRPLRRSPGEPLPASYAQRRLWFLDRLEPGSPVYHLPGAVRLTGPLDPDVLEDALAEVVRRHEALRTVLRDERGEPMQVVEPPPAAVLSRIDLAASPEPEAEAARWAREVATAPFDLARGPLFRALLLRRGPEDHELLLTLHHVVADGWSLRILLAELAALYAAFAAGRPSPLPELAVQYADWAVWQRERMAGDALESQIAWWRGRLAGAVPLELPADRPLAAPGPSRGGVSAASLPPALAAELERLARGAGATPFMLLLAAFQAQLARYSLSQSSGSASVAVGSPVANRGRAEVEGLIGFLVNMLVLRTPVDGDPGFRELLARAREACLGAYAHQDVPFERLVEALQPERLRARNPLFQAVFQLEEPLATGRLGEAAAAVRPLATGAAKFDLALSVARGPEGLAAALEYDAALFDAATAGRLLGHWRTLLAGIAADPDARLSDLPLLTAAEAAQLRGWSGFTTEYPRQATVHGLFAAEARRAPEAVAVESVEEGGARLTYGELETRANRLARRLRRLGVGLEVPVGLCLERSAELVVAMLAVLKAGGAYVPLDPSYPEDRLAFLAADTGFPVVVTREGTEAALPPGLPRVALAAGGELADAIDAIGTESAEPLPDLAGPESLACILYTSGSTGLPKGVQIVHRAVVRLMRGTDYAPFGPGEVFLQVAPPSFDASIVEVFGALLNGARVAILPAGAPSLDELAAAIAHHGVTALWLTAGLFHQMVELRLDGLRGPRSLIAGGDVISPELMRRAVEGLPGCLVSDAYGPTENTLFSTMQPLPDAAGVASPVPIGRPIANSTVHLLDAAFHPVPAGVPGELCVGGDGLARGYRGRPELTAERFVPNPFPSSTQGGERLYRTGDLARWRPDGSLEFLGRRDQQVKIRGFRVEPGEIEAVLARHPGVADVAVVVRDEPGGKALAAYVVPRGGGPLPEDLREHARAALPEYMRPAWLIALPELPLNANDKVDRRALAAREVRAAAASAVYEPPRTPVEERLAAIWGEVLGVERVGVHDDFFALGGHSLLAIRALARISEEFGVDLPVRDLFAAPTVAGLAERLAAGPAPQQEEEAPAAWTPPAAAAPRPPRTPAPASELPRNPLEEQLAAIWSEVLGVERIGVHDDFFDLGGHSLLAHRVAMRVARQMEIDLDLQVLFETPTVAALARRIAAGEMAPAARESGLPALTGESFPLSFAQQRLWLLDRIGPGGASYNLPAALRLEGILETVPLVRTLAEIVRRHEPLRTVYRVAGEEPVQVVLPPPGAEGLELARLDLGGLPAAARESVLWRALRQEGNRPFDLERGPVVRFLLIRLDDREHVLMATLHHIATDGWSMSVFLRELVVLYGDFAAGREPSLPAPPLRYAEWAARQRQDLEGGKLDAQLAYWRRQLAGLPVLELPTDRPRSTAAGNHSGNRRVELPAELAAGVRALAAGAGVTPFAVLLSGFAALLARLSGQDDFAIGLPSAGRNRAHAEGLIGFFVNTLVTRARLADDPPFRALLRRMRDTALAAQSHQDIPFERLVEELQPERAAGVSPLFQVLLNYMASPLARMPLPGLTVSFMDIELGVAKFDLTFSTVEDGGELRGWVEYRAALFDPATVERWMGHLRTLLAAAAADPALQLSALPLLSAPERWQVVGEWNATEGAQLPDPRLHRLIEAQVARTPGAVAVAFEDEVLTYAGLNARANRLARRLRAFGAGPEARVAVSLERSPDLVVALVAVLKAGGAYVPLDPSYPQSRLDFMLEDSSARVLVTREPLLAGPLAAALERPEIAALCLDRDAAAIDAEDAADLAGGAGPDDLAYVIYTSGSTGRPKGAMNAHRGVVNRLLWMQDTYRLGAADRVLQKTPMSFDVSVWEFFWPLMTGATLVVARPGGHQDNAYLVDLIERAGITTLHFVPSMLALWLEEPGVERCRGLRRVITSGEALALEHERRLFERLPGAELHNLYGPTEAAVDVTWWRCEPGSRRRSVPIGRPLRNVAIHLADRGLRPVPAGVAGELLIGGVQVGRGYHGRPALTAEKFIPDPFAAAPGERLYRTGDLARWLPGGEIEYLGRIDHQVKIRGVRIELGEIEAALRDHPAVRDAVAIVREIGPDDRRIVAYSVLHEEPRPDLAAELRSALAARLPDAMVPSAFIFLDAFPLSPNGKLDRAALPAAEWSSERRFVASRTQVEEVLAGAFAGLLQVERVGVEDDFFAVGGHSLLATRLVSRIRDSLGVELAVRTVFAHPTVAALARAVESASGAALPPIERAPRGEFMPQSYSQARLWFLYQLAPRSAAYNMALAVRFEGRLDVPALAGALSEIVRRHEVLRSTFDTVAGEPVQRVREAAPLPLPVVDLAALPPEARRWEVLRLAGEEGRRPFDIVRGPVARAALLAAGPGDHHLLITLHHIASDGWSWGVLARELEALYPAFLAGAPSPLPELPVQFADFAVWQRRWLEEGGHLEAQLAYWREQLRGAPPLLALATDRPRPEVQSFAGTHLDFHLGAEPARALLALGREQGATLYMAMLAAFSVLLGRWSGQRDIVVGSPVANRRRAELEPLVGFFVNTMTLRTDLARAGTAATGGPSFRELLAHTREVTLGAFMHQDLPFEKLVEELQPERQLSHSPIFQVLYVYQNTPGGEGSRPLPGLTLSMHESEDLGAQFDLTLILGEEADGRLKASLYYSTALFDATTVERLWSHLAALVEGAVAAPEAPLSALPGLAEAEREVLLRRANAPARVSRERVRGMRSAGLLPSAAELREFLLARIPEYMVPSAFVYLDALPLTYSGKRDLRALPAPEAADQDAEVYVAPRTPVEETLAAILAELLKRERVGVESNLFEMGGHSLMVMQLIGRIREAFGVELTVQNVFETPTVAGLAAVVDTWRWAAAPAAVLAAGGEEIEMEEMEL
jgi:amino acid adenylation domain-containing protein